MPLRTPHQQAHRGQQGHKAGLRVDAGREARDGDAVLGQHAVEQRRKGHGAALHGQLVGVQEGRVLQVVVDLRVGGGGSAWVEAPRRGGTLSAERGLKPMRRRPGWSTVLMPFTSSFSNETWRWRKKVRG